MELAFSPNVPASRISSRGSWQSEGQKRVSIRRLLNRMNSASPSHPPRGYAVTASVKKSNGGRGGPGPLTPLLSSVEASGLEPVVNLRRRLIALSAFEEGCRLANAAYEADRGPEVLQFIVVPVARKHDDERQDEGAGQQKRHGSSVSNNHMQELALRRQITRPSRQCKRGTGYVSPYGIEDVDR